SFCPQGQTVDCGFAAENDGNAAFLPSSVFDRANCNKTIKASSTHSFPMPLRLPVLTRFRQTPGDVEAIESVLAGIHDSDDAPSGDATFYLTPDAFAKFVGGSVPRSPKDVEDVWDHG
ncbi:hypothetical protein EV714DRAFT_204898, partial [Schizophyllum commune]